MRDNIIGRVVWTWEACDSCAKQEMCNGDLVETINIDGDIRCRDYEPEKEADE